MVFNLANESYALDIQSVQEIVLVQNITSVPGTKPWVRGTTNLRGRAVPIIDLRERCNVAVNEYTAATRIVVVTSGSGLVGFIVDGVSEVLRIPAADVDAISNIASTSGNRYLRGVAKLVAGLVSLMDLDALIPSDIAETETSVA